MDGAELVFIGPLSFLERERKSWLGAESIRAKKENWREIV